MTLFVLIGALLAALTVVALTWPLWASRRKPATAPAGTAVDALRAQLEQLTALKQSGVLGGAAYDEAREALERRIVEAVVIAPPAASAPAGLPKTLLLGLGAFVCAVTVGGYAWLGTPQALALAVEFETLCEQYWRALQIGEPKLLDDEEMERVLAKFGSYGQ